MKIALVSQPVDWVLPPNQNSIGIWTYQVARRLAEQHEVYVYAKRTRAQNAAAGERAGYRFIRSIPNRVWDRPRGWHWPPQAQQRPLFAFPFFYGEYIAQVAADIRRLRCDVIHIQNSPHFVPIVRALNPEARIVLHMHCEWLTQLDPALMRRRLAQVDVVIGCSNYIVDKVRARFPEFADKCYTVFNGVDVAAFSPADGHNHRNGSKQLLFVGRVSPEKGVHVLMDAYRIVRARYPETRLTLVGPVESVPQELIVSLSDVEAISKLTAFYDGAYIDHLRRRIPAEAAGQVTFTGSVAHEDVAQRYRETDVLINPSFSEAFGMSLVEAMASRTPVVASRVGGMTDVVEDGVTGYLVQPGDVDELASAVLRLLDGRESAAAMGRAGRRRAVELFSWDSIVEQLVDLYAGSQRRESD